MSRAPKFVSLAIACLAVSQLATGLHATTYWWRGSSNNNMSNLDSYDTQEDGLGGPPSILPQPGDLIEVTAAANVGFAEPKSDADLSFGAMHLNANCTSQPGCSDGFMFIGGGFGGNVNWTLDRTTVGSEPNAVFINDTGIGFNTRANLVFDGGGDFVISHNSGSTGEFDSASWSETNGSANLIFDGGGRMEYRGNLGGSYALTGDITVKDSTFTGTSVVRFDHPFDVSSTMGQLIVDPDSVGARFNLEVEGDSIPDTFTVGGLTVKGFSLPAGTYVGPGDFKTITQGGKVPDVFGDLSTSFEGNVINDPSMIDTIVVTGGGAGGSADYDHDGDIDGHDFLVWQRGGSTNGLTSGDLSLWQSQYGTPLTANIGAVPEPGSLLLGCLGTLLIAVSRRRAER